MFSITNDQIPMIFLILAVAVLSLILFLIGFKSYLTSRDRKILFVASAFGMFFIKNVTIVASLLYDIFPHTNLEFVGALFDLITLILLIIPLLKNDL
ncbi:MAG: hypothetical protein ACW967_06690 [Candidatus Hodarchaeales archaeon]